MTKIIKNEEEGRSPTERITRYSIDNSWKDEIDEFAGAIVDNKPILYGGAVDALKTMELVYRIYCADTSWKEKYNLKT